MAFPQDGKLDEAHSGGFFQLAGCGLFDKSSSLTSAFVFFVSLLVCCQWPLLYHFKLWDFLTPAGNNDLCLATAELIQVTSCVLEDLEQCP